MTPTEAHAWLATLPEAQRGPGRAALSGAFHDGFLRGAAKLPRIDPYQEEPAKPSDSKKKR